jgi:hypothetical protein
MERLSIDYLAEDEGEGSARVYTLELLAGDIADWIGRPEAHDPEWATLLLEGDLVLGVALKVGPAIAAAGVQLARGREV